MGITLYPLPQKNGNIPLTSFGGNYPIFILDNIYQLLYVYINWFTRVIFFDDLICSTKKLGVTTIIKKILHNGELPLPW